MDTIKDILLLISDYCEIKRHAGRILIKNRSTSLSYPPHTIESILVFGKTSITSDSLDICIEYNIPIIFCTKTGRVRGLLYNFQNSRALNTRLYQYEIFRNKEKRISTARSIVCKKVENIERVFEIDLGRIRAELSRADTLERLLNLEGQASKKMFKKFGSIVKDYGFNFESRSYYPPKDETNALLSFVYTLGFSSVLAYTLALGFDPYISFLHIRRGAHQSLVSDLLEVVRPHLTKFVQNLITDRLVIISDFVRAGDNQDNRESIIFLNRGAIERVSSNYNKMKKELLNEVSNFLKLFIEKKI